MKRAFITGISGQDGSYLTELLLAKRYEVHGFVRRSATPLEKRVKFDPRLLDTAVDLHFGDITDPLSLRNAIAEVRPHEIYNLAAQTFVPNSWESPLYTAEATGISIINLLEAVRSLKLETKIYHASTSELFSGEKGEAPQDERTPLNPNNPYGIAKLFAHKMAQNYREAYGMFICNGILFNHESPRRGENFVTRKITQGVARIHLGLRKKLYLGNLGSKRDWGHAKEYVEAMWKMLQQPKPDDYVLGTGQMHSVAEFAKEAFKVVGLNWKDYVVSDKRFFRPKEVQFLQANPAKAKRVLKWSPKIGFKELVKEMVSYDIENLERPKIYV